MTLITKNFIDFLTKTFLENPITSTVDVVSGPNINLRSWNTGGQSQVIN